MMEASEQGNDRISLQYEPTELGDEMKARIPTKRQWQRIRHLIKMEVGRTGESAQAGLRSTQEGPGTHTI